MFMKSLPKCMSICLFSSLLLLVKDLLYKCAHMYNLLNIGSNLTGSSIFGAICGKLEFLCVKFADKGANEET